MRRFFFILNKEFKYPSLAVFQFILCIVKGTRSYTILIVLLSPLWDPRFNNSHYAGEAAGGAAGYPLAIDASLRRAGSLNFTKGHFLPSRAIDCERPESRPRSTEKLGISRDPNCTKNAIEHREIRFVVKIPRGAKTSPDGAWTRDGERRKMERGRQRSRLPSTVRSIVSLAVRR